MASQPTIETERLILRPFTPSDAPVVQRLAGDRAIAATTLNIPHPYEDGMAEEWISTHKAGFEKEILVNFAIVLKNSKELVGAIGLTLEKGHARAELGYWIGKPYWNQGYASEAGKSVVKYGFETLDLNRIHAFHFKRNTPSGKVLRNIGMSHEGCRRKHVRKWDAYEDVEMYGVLREDTPGSQKETRIRGRSQPARDQSERRKP